LFNVTGPLKQLPRGAPRINPDFIEDVEFAHPAAGRFLPGPGDYLDADEERDQTGEPILQLMLRP